MECQNCTYRDTRSCQYCPQCGECATGDGDKWFIPFGLVTAVSVLYVLVSN